MFSFIFLYSGIILFELLQLIPAYDWDNAISGLRKRMFPAYTTIKDTEKRCINALLSEEPARRPSITDILGFVETQVETRKLHFKC